jgi:hypothetical protein
MASEILAVVPSVYGVVQIEARVPKRDLRPDCPGIRWFAANSTLQPMSEMAPNPTGPRTQHLMSTTWIVS